MGDFAKCMKRKSIKFAVMTIQQAKERLLFQLYHIYDDREAASIADWVLEHLTGWKKIDRVINKNLPLNAEQKRQLEQYITELLVHRPVQYVLGEAWFQGMKFFVNESTLIPRPETEELVEWLIADYKEMPAKYDRSVIDIGTGSGCIPISIKKKLPGVWVTSCDVSAAAIGVASMNARTLETNVEFVVADILDDANWSALPECDTIISNPPYVRHQEKATMEAHVVNYEPALALFVPDNEALVFYDRISLFGLMKLKEGGRIYFEINEALKAEVVQLLESRGYTDIIPRKDMQGKERMIRATKPSTT